MKSHILYVEKATENRGKMSRDKIFVLSPKATREFRHPIVSSLPFAAKRWPFKFRSKNFIFI
jgi:hypothetical protein